MWRQKNILSLNIVEEDDDGGDDGGEDAELGFDEEDYSNDCSQSGISQYFQFRAWI